jgi:hypothetical protein
MIGTPMMASSHRAARTSIRSGESSGHPEAGALVAGRYVLLEKLGAGGTSAVHLARDEATGRMVAFKQLLASLAGRHRRLIEAMFEREYHTLARLKHPRVIEVYDYGVMESGPFYTMELLSGGDLQQRSPLPYRDVCAHLRDIASLLALLSAQRLVHRDISPRNVRFAADGRAKLIDFGALTPFGRTSDIVGTPPCMAPEALSKMGVDQRTDLYALGAVAYFALTGGHAYPARRLEDLPAMWLTPPPAPSAFVAEIPPALDTLVLSLLRADPLSRPSSAAAVLDELCAIGELPTDEHAVAAESYLQSGRIVGREEEQRLLRERLAQARAGVGGEVVLDGAPGVGKTRLLFETALEAQLQGTTVLSADGQASPEPFGVANALGLQLLTTSSELGREAAGTQASVLAHLSEALRQKLGSPELAVLSVAPPERRAQLQAALHEWFLVFADAKPLLIALDNLHAVDDNSAAFLAALGMDAKHRNMLLICTRRLGEPIRAPVPVRKLQERSARVTLNHLPTSACVDLVKAIFGDVPNAGRLAYVLHKRSGGNPQQFTELVRLLAKNEVVKYVSGTWVLPGEVNADELPRDVEALSDARVDALGADALGMLDGLSIHARPVALELSIALAEGLSAAQAHAALATLIAEQLLILEEGRYRFARDAQQKARYERMPEALRQERHRRAAALLATRTEDLAAQLEAGEHWLRAGDESEGAALIAPLGRRMANADGTEELPEIVPALHAALGVYEKQGRPPQVRAEPMFLMLSIGYLTPEWRLLYEHGVRAIELGADVLGFSRARRLQPWLGRKLALAVGILVAVVRFACVPRRSRGWTFGEAFNAFVRMLTSVCGTILLSHDAEKLDRIRSTLEPLSWFGPNHPLTFLYGFLREQTHMARGQLHLTLADYETASVALHSPSMRKGLSPEHVKHLHGGMLCTVAILHCYASDSRALALASEAEALEIRIWRQGATQARVLYHAMRGESEPVQRYRSELELLAVQGGASWQVELVLPTALLGPEFLSADTVAVRRLFEQLTRRARVVHAVAPYADAAEAMYLTLRGQLPQAIAVYERILPQFLPHSRHYWMLIHSAFAQALNRSGQHARAKELLTEALQHTVPEERHFICLFLEAERQLALAEAGLQHHDTAAHRLEALLAKHRDCDNPLLVGLLRKARAEVALMVDDQAGFDRHYEPLEHLFRATRNPALVAQSERLMARAVRSGLRSAPESPPTQDVAAASVQLSRMHTGAASLEYLLKAMVDHARATAGYLYVYAEGSGMRLLAANQPEEAPSGLETQLREQADRIQSEARFELAAVEPTTQMDSDQSAVVAVELAKQRVRAEEDASEEQRTRIVSAAPPASQSAEAEPRSQVLATTVGVRPHETHHLLVLRSTRAGPARVVGGLILAIDPDRALLLPPSLIDAAADALYAHGTVVTQ